MNFYKTGIWLIVTGFLLIVIVTGFFLFKTTDLNQNTIATDVWGHYGDTIGGLVGTIVAFVGVLMLYETLTQQRNAFAKQLVETRFFELIRLHRDNVNEIRSKGKSGRDVFVTICDEMKELYDKIKLVYPQNASIDGKNSNVAEWRKEIAQIAYLIVFYGVNNSNDAESIRIIEDTTKLRGNGQKVVNLFGELTKEHSDIKFRNKSRQDSTDATKRNLFLNHDGHQVRLAHYFRHLYHTVQYINSRPATLLTYAEKNQYLKLLRAQLSTHEQATLFFNSLSRIGLSWELGRKSCEINLHLITKYDLIRNMPVAFTGEIAPKNYYPNVFFEYDTAMTDQKKQMVSKYN
jgi:hypothetical protein